MAFLDKLSSMAKNAMDKTGEMIEIGNLNSKITAERGKITELKQKIGEHYWGRFTEGGALEPEPAALCEEIKTREETIVAIQADIQAKKDAAQTQQATVQAPPPPPVRGLSCAACGVLNPDGTKFCQGCGAKLEIPTGGGICSCGAAVPAESKFCPECGRPAAQPEAKTMCACGTEIPSASRFCPQCGASAQRAGGES